MTVKDNQNASNMHLSNTLKKNTLMRPVTGLPSDYTHISITGIL